MIYYLPLEPIENRYTNDWWYMFDEVMLPYKSVKVIPDTIDTTKATKGSFFNWNNTFVFKFRQLSKLFSYNFSKNDWIFVMDGEFPGLEALEYFKRLTKNKVKLAVIWHAGTYDTWDDTTVSGLSKIGRYLEEVWFDIADIIFVGSRFHKNLILKNRMVDSSKIKVVGLPIRTNLDVFYKNNKKHDIIFGGRLSYSKGYDIINSIKQKYDIFVAQEHNLNRNEYFEELGQSKIQIVPSRQETFGYCAIEGAAMGIPTIVPNILSFTENFKSKFMYSSESKMFELLDKYLAMDSLESSKIMFDIKNSLLKKYNYPEVIERMLGYLV